MACFSLVIFYCPDFLVIREDSFGILVTIEHHLSWQGFSDEGGGAQWAKLKEQ